MNKTKNQVIDQQNENNENKNQSINPRQRDQRRLSIETLTALNRAAHDAMKEIQGDRTTAEAVSDSELYCDLMQISLLGYNRWLDYERKKQQYRDMKMDDLLKRARAFLDWVGENYAGQTVLAVGHGIINKAIQAVHYGLLMREVPKMSNAEYRILQL